MSTLADKNFIFIAGVEGSGTTILLQLLGSFPFAVSLGGNWMTPGFEAEGERLNGLTKQLWKTPSELDEAAKQHLYLAIQSLELPHRIEYVIYKRSYPFHNRDYFPELSDLEHINPNLKIILMTRHIENNTKSILRRGFETTYEAAEERSQEAREVLRQQLADNVGLPILQIAYEDMINPDKKVDILNKVEAFIEFPSKTVHQKAYLITKPTGPAKKLFDSMKSLLRRA